MLELINPFLKSVPNLWGDLHLLNIFFFQHEERGRPELRGYARNGKEKKTPDEAGGANDSYENDVIISCF